MLTCTVCNESRSEESFSRRKDRPKGYTSRCKECDRKDWSKRKKPELQRAYKLQTNYGLSLEDYQSLLDKQGGLCAICKQTETSKSNVGKPKNLAVDHCHTTGKVRGLLCHHCNTGIGKFMDKVDLLESAIKYLKENL